MMKKEHILKTPKYCGSLPQYSARPNRVRAKLYKGGLHKSYARAHIMRDYKELCNKGQLPHKPSCIMHQFFVSV